MNHLITVPHSVMVVLGKMRDEIGSLIRKAKDCQIAYDILVAEHADLKLKYEHQARVSGLLDEELGKLYAKYDTLQFEFGAMEIAVRQFMINTE